MWRKTANASEKIGSSSGSFAVYATFSLFFRAFCLEVMRNFVYLRTECVSNTKIITESELII